MNVSIVPIEGLVFPDSSPYQRIAPPKCQIADSAFWDYYDHKTLFYMAIFDAQKQELTLFAPLLLNFKAIALSAKYSIDGVSLPQPKYRQGDKFDCLILHCAKAGNLLRVDIDDFSGVIPITMPEPDLFAGTNLVFTMSRDNNLMWIRDWLIWNHKTHGADAVLFLDNGSTTYTTKDLAQTIASVPGYRRAQIVSVPFRFGPPIETASYYSDCQFLQATLLNVLWKRFMFAANAMLNVDIDELMIAPNGLAIFDAVKTARWGIIVAKGKWRYSQPMTSLCRHSDHYYKIETDTPCPTKYCVRPNSVAGRRILKVHNVKGLKRMPFVDRKTFQYLHCRNISTSWKYDRSQIDASNLVEDTETRRALTSVFG